MDDYSSKPNLWNRLKGLFSRVSFTSDDESDDLGTRAMKKARKQQRRRDEFVTKRELDVLRKVRRERDTQLPLRSKPNLVQPQAPLPTPPGSAKEDTLRKINEIERMMSVDIKGSSQKAAADKEKEAQNRAFLPTQPMSAMVDKPVVIARPDAAGSSAEMTESQRIAAAFARTNLLTRPMTRGAPVPSRAGGTVSTQGEAATSDNFLNSMLMGQTMMNAMEVQEQTSDPALEEAAIHFANGEYEDAEKALKNTIAMTGPNYKNVESWRALFDLYRATGEQSKFESLGLDFVSLFDTSAPNWFSLSGDASLHKAERAGAAGPAAYVCPGRVDGFVANQLYQFVEMRLMSGGVVALDFSKLQTLGNDAAEGLAKALLSLNSTVCKVSITEPGRFTDNAQALTVANDKSVSQAAWAVRLEWLRLIGKPDDFEAVALDYCVANEMSPPSWVASKAGFTTAGAKGSQASGSVSIDQSPSSWALEPLSTPSQLNDSLPSDIPLTESSKAELQGEITAGSVVVTPEIAAAAQQSHVAINCAKLKRIDFASAGTLLNWVLEQVGEGKQVNFYDTHRLIAAFFGVIGISTHARVMIRRD